MIKKQNILYNTFPEYCFMHLLNLYTLNFTIQIHPYVCVYCILMQKYVQK